VICPRGGTGAKSSYQYIVSQGVSEGVSEERLQILEGGIYEWPYKEMFIKGR
jgi:hypothetical protein